MIEIAIQTINGKEIPAVTSLQVAEHFGKEHRNVLAAIRKILDTDEDGFGALNFQLSSYLSEQNKEMPMYVMSKDGFVLLVMGYTGAEAMRMKKAYIARFNEMEKALQVNAPTSQGGVGKHEGTPPPFPAPGGPTMAPKQFSRKLLSSSQSNAGGYSRR